MTLLYPRESTEGFAPRLYPAYRSPNARRKNPW